MMPARVVESFFWGMTPFSLERILFILLRIQCQHSVPRCLSNQFITMRPNDKGKEYDE